MTSLARVRIPDEAILDAATDVFASEGYDRANMDAIAARAGATKPTLYARFGSKDEVFAAAVRRGCDLRKRALLEAYGPGEDRRFRERPHGWVAAYFDFVQERPAGFVLVSEGERHPASAAVVERAGTEIVDRIAQLVVRVSGRDAPVGAHLVASMITGMLTGCAREALRRDDIDLDRAAA